MWHCLLLSCSAAVTRLAPGDGQVGALDHPGTQGPDQRLSSWSVRLSHEGTCVTGGAGRQPSTRSLEEAGQASFLLLDVCARVCLGLAGQAPGGQWGDGEQASGLPLEALGFSGRQASGLRKPRSRTPPWPAPCSRYVSTIKGQRGREASSSCPVCLSPHRALGSSAALQSALKARGGRCGPEWNPKLRKHEQEKLGPLPAPNPTCPPGEHAAGL